MRWRVGGRVDVGEWVGVCSRRSVTASPGWVCGGVRGCGWVRWRVGGRSDVGGCGWSWVELGIGGRVWGVGVGVCGGIGGRVWQGGWGKWVSGWVGVLQPWTG